jgi:coenzyme F420 hydrogenase subunit beta
VEHQNLVKKLFEEVILPGNCFHCGLCEGLSNNLFKMNESKTGPIPYLIRKPSEKDLKDLKKIFIACPGRGVPYNFLLSKGKAKNKNNIIGNYNSIFTASSNNKIIRQNGSSGGIVRTILLEMIKKHIVDYVCVLDEKKNKILKYDIITTKSEFEIKNLSQSIYVTTPILHKIKNLKKNKKYCFVGLPEHIAALRILKLKFPKEFSHIKFLIGIYAGTNMYPGAINYFLSGNNIKNLSIIKKIDWRYGEWPGKLRIVTKDNKELTLKKFYYNYLIPFFISKNCLITPDLTSELSDISIGDAWSPKLEKKGFGYSVVISRSKYFDKLLYQLDSGNKISLKKIKLMDCINMHAHMIEFKKIGSYLRLKFLKKDGPVPSYDLKPENVSFKRQIIERCIGFIIAFCSINIINKIFLKLNPKVLGYIFEFLRNIWKKISKSTKRRGLNKIKFSKVNSIRVKELKS